MPKTSEKPTPGEVGQRGEVARKDKQMPLKTQWKTLEEVPEELKFLADQGHIVEKKREDGTPFFELVTVEMQEIRARHRSTINEVNSLKQEKEQLSEQISETDDLKEKLATYESAAQEEPKDPNELLQSLCEPVDFEGLEFLVPKQVAHKVKKTLGTTSTSLKELSEKHERTEAEFHEQLVRADVTSAAAGIKGFRPTAMKYAIAEAKNRTRQVVGEDGRRRLQYLKSDGEVMFGEDGEATAGEFLAKLAEADAGVFVKESPSTPGYNPPGGGGDGKLPTIRDVFG